MRSDIVKKGIERAPHRSLFRATGIVKDASDFKKPMIAIANSFVEIIPGHAHLQEFGKIAKDAVRAAGWIPFEFNTIGICDGIAMGHAGMNYSLPSRELIADSMESMLMAHPFDGVVCITNCDKIVPGMLMAMCRVNIPAIIVSGGPMEAGKCKSGKSDLITVFEGVGAVAGGTMTEKQLNEIEACACPGVGSCSGMFTANSMNCLCEALGIALPGNGTRLAISKDRRELVKQASARIMDLVKKNIKPRDIINAASIRNAFVADMAMGGSTNTVLHTLAVAKEAGGDFSVKAFNALAAQAPHLRKISPAQLKDGKQIHIGEHD